MALQSMSTRLSSKAFQSPSSYVEYLSSLLLKVVISQKKTPSIVTTPRSQRCRTAVRLCKCDTKKVQALMKSILELEIKAELILPLNSPFQTFSNNLPFPPSVMTK